MKVIIFLVVSLISFQSFAQNDARSNEQQKQFDLMRAQRQGLEHAGAYLDVTCERIGPNELNCPDGTYTKSSKDKAVSSKNKDAGKDVTPTYDENAGLRIDPSVTKRQ